MESYVLVERVSRSGVKKFDNPEKATIVGSSVCG